MCCSGELPLRADAARNRRALLDAASEAFAEQGLDVTVAEIARRAGVGQGTAFRRFPTKDELVAAVIGERIMAMSDFARESLQAKDPWEGFASFFRFVVELHVRDRGLFQAFIGSEHPPRLVVEHVGRLHGKIGLLLQRAQDAGAIREDLDASDIPVLAQAAAEAGCKFSASRPDLWQRYVSLFLDGIRPGNTTELTTPPATFADIERLISN